MPSRDCVRAIVPRRSIAVQKYARLIGLHCRPAVPARAVRTSAVAEAPDAAMGATVVTGAHAIAHATLASILFRKATPGTLHPDPTSRESCTGAREPGSQMRSSSTDPKHAIIICYI